MHSAIIDRAELCVHRNKMLNGRAAIGSLPMSARQAEAACLSCTAIWRTARARDRLIGFRCRLHRANECAHELAFQLRRQGIDVYAFAGEELPCILDRIDPRRLDADRAEPCLRQLVPVFLVSQRSGYAADPQQHLPAYRGLTTGAMAGASIRSVATASSSVSKFRTSGSAPQGHRAERCRGATVLLTIPGHQRFQQEPALAA